MRGYWSAFVGGLIISILSFIPGDNLPETDIRFADLAVHLALYWLWLSLIFWESAQYGRLKSRYSTMLVLLTTFLFGAATEIIQEQFIPGRFGSFSDVAANSFGILFGFGTYLKFLKQVK